MMMFYFLYFFRIDPPLRATLKEWQKASILSDFSNTNVKATFYTILS